MPIARTTLKVLGVATWTAVLLLAPTLQSGAEGPDSQTQPTSHPSPGAGLEAGPSSTQAQLEEDERLREEVVGVPWLDDFFGPFFDWKKEVRKKTGLGFGGDYTALYQGATSSPGEQQAASGMWRFFGNWEVLDRQGDFTGSLAFKVENRHALGTDISPIELGFEIGSSVPTGVPFTDAGWLLSNLFWKQRLGDRITLQFGQVDPTDYLDLYGLVNPWTSFTNLAFLTNPTIPTPDQGLGAALGGWVNENIYAIAGISDPTADPTKPFDDFFGEGEFFAHGEVGWTTKRDRLLLDNFHIAGWYIDERSESGLPSGWGLAFSGTWFFGERWMPFLRAGYADGGRSLLEANISVGLGMLFRDADLLGMGLSWGRPPGNRSRDQYTTEFYYRIQVLPSLVVTPDIQLIIDPSSNPDESVIAVFGLRARLAF